MYDYNLKNDKKIEGSDIMIYSPNVYVIRDDHYKLYNNPFTLNVISSPAVDNRHNITNSNQLMETRIRKIVRLAAYKNIDILILGAFGCGIFKNPPSKIAQIFYKVLIDENLKDYFKSIVFPIYKSEINFQTFKSILYHPDK